MVQSLTIQTEAPSQLIDITREVEALVQQQDLRSGIMVLYCPHTTCGLTIQESYDPGVQHDMLLVLNRIVPRTDPGYRHLEDNSASHLQTSMLGVSQLLLIEEGRLLLGRWQGIFLAEFDGPRERTVLVKIQPDR